MKYFTFLFSALVMCAQVQVVSPSTPAKAEAKPPVKPDTVLFKVGDRPVTAAEFERVIATFPPEIAQSAKNNPRQVMQSYYLMQSLSKRAEDEKLDQTSPFKEQLALQRMQYLATQIVNRESSRITVAENDVQAKYEADKAEKYEQAKLSAIVIMYTDPKTAVAQVDMSNPKKMEPKPVSGVRLEPEAKKIADDVVAKLRAGADFAALAKEKSDDKNSAAKGGDFGVIRRSDRVPDDLKRAAFALKPGEVSEPIKQPLGFYIVKLEDRKVQPFTEVRAMVENELKQERFQKWMSGLQKEYEVSLETPSYFEPAPAPKMPGAPSGAKPMAPGAPKPGATPATK
mgnify:CR=1 FL=1